MSNLTRVQEHYMRRLRAMRKMDIGRGPTCIHHATAKALERKGLVTIKQMDSILAERYVELVEEEPELKKSVDDLLWQVLTRLDEVSRRVEDLSKRLEAREILDRRLQTLETRWEILYGQVRHGGIGVREVEHANKQAKAIAEVLGLFDPVFAYLAGVKLGDTNIEQVVQLLRQAEEEKR